MTNSVVSVITFLSVPSFLGGAVGGAYIYPMIFEEDLVNASLSSILLDAAGHVSFIALSGVCAPITTFSLALMSFGAYDRMNKGLRKISHKSPVFKQNVVKKYRDRG